MHKKYRYIVNSPDSLHRDRSAFNPIFPAHVGPPQMLPTVGAGGRGRGRGVEVVGARGSRPRSPPRSYRWLNVTLEDLRAALCCPGRTKVLAGADPRPVTTCQRHSPGSRDPRAKTRMSFWRGGLYVGAPPCGGRDRQGPGSHQPGLSGVGGVTRAAGSSLDRTM